MVRSLLLYYNRCYYALFPSSLCNNFPLETPILYWDNFLKNARNIYIFYNFLYMAIQNQPVIIRF